MTEPTPTPAENELLRAKDAARQPPAHVAGSEHLPDDTANVAIDDDGSSPNHYEGD